MQIYSIETGNFMLDGGAMFGVVPKLLWEKSYPANEKNLCNLAMRCLLIVQGDRKILIDTGLGDKQDEKFFNYLYLNGEATLAGSLNALGFAANEITDVLFTHLHFDHVGGAVYRSGNDYVLSFPNAVHWVSKRQWDWAMQPNQRERASYLKENIRPIQESGKLKFIDAECELVPNVALKMYHGHSDGQLIPYINYRGRTLIYAADLMPTAAHIPMSYVVGYDTRPLLSFQERKRLYVDMVQNNGVLFFEHDLYHECCTVKETEKGIKVDKLFSLDDFKAMV